jgi:hypothetical protein
MNYKITNLTNSSLTIEDINVRLPGKGSSVVVDANSADKSKDLALNKSFVKIEKVPYQKNPLIKLDSLPVPSDYRKPESISVIDTLRDDVAEIKSTLAVILSRIESLRDRPSVPPPAPLATDKWIKKANKR